MHINDKTGDMDDQSRSQNGVRPEESGEAPTATKETVTKDVVAKSSPVEEGVIDEGHEWETKKNFRRALPQMLATSAKNMLLLAYGMTLGFPTIVIPSLQDPNASVRMTQEQISWFSSINLITVPLGCIISGALTDRLGKKRAMIAVNIPFLVSWSLFYWSTGPGHLYAAMVLSGLAGGLLEAPVLTYVAEITEPHLRGFLSATASSCVILGIFLEFLFGTIIGERTGGHGGEVLSQALEATPASTIATVPEANEGWRLAAAISAALPMLAMIALFCVPESPHWLIAKGRMEDAQHSLRWLRGWVPFSHVKKEFDMLVTTIQGQKIARSRKTQMEIKRAASEGVHIEEKGFGAKLCSRIAFRIKPYLIRTFLKPYMLICTAFFVGHFGGMTTLQTFAVSIFSTVGSPVGRYTSTLVLGIVELLGTVVCAILIHWLGKRPLSIFSTTAAACCFISVATISYLNGPVNPTEDAPWAPLILLTLSAFFSHTGLRLLPWILIGEVYPPEVRAMASGASGSAGYIFGFAANKTFFALRDTLTLPGVFWLNGIIGFLGGIYLYFILPETEGHPLHEIQQHFEGKRDLRKAGVAHKAKNRALKAKEERENWAADNPAMTVEEGVTEEIQADPEKGIADKESKIEYESRL
ncbi:facilitated trehalose transporter Tret1-like [Ischnura elegans]|uniref:facilitated trehalose transporter Tret1-like n=1 Tax=Ischnura elegans TaxID=197161 RepID=UPI001ED8871D|nr:facilitated trehalose transporter Tret1-like [Ischnura elegans]